MSDEKFSDAPVDDRDKGTIAENLVLGGILKGDWRDHKVKDECESACDSDCKCNHLKVIK